MALDGIVTRAIVSEFQACVGARIHKIHQPTEHDLVLQMRGAGGGRLLISANPTYPRLHWTEMTFLNPLEPPMFCMLLRKHCEGGVIEAVRQIGRERIVHIDVRQRDELGDLSLKTIVVELMGRHSNIILLDSGSGTIYDGIHHVTPAISSYRIVMPGSRYTAPPEQDKTDPLEVTGFTRFAELLAGGGDSTLAPEKRLVAAFSGMSPLLAKELLYRAKEAAGAAEETHRTQLLARNEAQNEGGRSQAGTVPEDDKSPNPSSDSSTTPGSPDAMALWRVFDGLMEEVRQERCVPEIVQTDSGKSFFSITELTHLQGERSRFDGISRCLEAFYGDKAERDTVKQRATDLIRFLNNEKNKNEKKLEKLQETLEEAKDAEKYRVLGELLTAYLHSIKKGQTSVEVINYYDEEQAPVTIALDPLLTPSENAQRYFRKYTKHKNSQAVVAEQMERTRNEIVYLETLLQQVDSASLSDIGEIRDELVSEGYLRDRTKRGAKRKKPARPTLLCYTSSEGVAIWVGKNNTQNEYLTNRLAGPSDTWLHTKDIPGSHVVIRDSGFGNVTLEEAAMLAAHYSQASGSSLVPVDYTQVRYVRKPSGAKPGFVIYDHQKTLFITPDEQRLKQLPVQVKN
ncbi:Rqc2 family fibronectin-binding protein [Paenibacillus beijingensis]|uniref:Rqc2 homolog RqcH n=1 Tax=Paenibacillus beijingensis TaxID=1126833 RepID=A0A0D5NMQ9_9BACL|nr:NFACT RNA binding domain-containing protein [Paenibacillus beijingensis]AJY76450.1 hypothetical protein VN24_20085 [Paenibacillus beijingensis]